MAHHHWHKLLIVHLDSLINKINDLLPTKVSFRGEQVYTVSYVQQSFWIFDWPGLFHRCPPLGSSPLHLHQSVSSPLLSSPGNLYVHLSNIFILVWLKQTWRSSAADINPFPSLSKTRNASRNCSSPPDSFNFLQKRSTVEIVWDPILPPYYYGEELWKVNCAIWLKTHLVEQILICLLIFFCID